MAKNRETSSFLSALNFVRIAKNGPLKGHSQLCDRADLDTCFVSFEKRLPQPEIKGTRRIHLETRLNLPIVLLDFQSFTENLFLSMLLLIL